MLLGSEASGYKAKENNYYIHPWISKSLLFLQSTQAKSKVWILIIQNWPVGFRDTSHPWFCFRKSYIIYKRRWHDCSMQKAYWPVLGSTFLHNFIIRTDIAPNTHIKRTYLPMGNNTWNLIQSSKRPIHHLHVSHNKLLFSPTILHNLWPDLGLLFVFSV